MAIDYKIELGKKIKMIRLEKQMTQADLCGDEAELTIRQLARIENGQAMISIPKLAYVAQVFEMPMQDLVDLNQMVLPKEYLVLKNKLIHAHTYGDVERIKRHEAMFDEIYEKYYDNLPEEEQLSVEILQVRLDTFSSQNPNYAISLFDEYLHQVLKKSSYSSNDLLLIAVYLFCCAVGLEENQYFDEFAEKVLLYTDYSDPEKMFVFELVLLAVLIQIVPEKYLIYTRILREVIEETNSFIHKPAVYMFEARYYHHVEHDRDKAAESYDKAISFAKMLNDEILVKNVEMEKATDLAT